MQASDQPQRVNSASVLGGVTPPGRRRTASETTPAQVRAAEHERESVIVDLAKPEGQVIVRRLAERPDVLLENFKVGSLSRLGLRWEDLSLLNPRLVYCFHHGVRAFGPYKDRPGYDFMVQAMGGLTA